MPVAPSVFAKIGAKCFIKDFHCKNPRKQTFKLIFIECVVEPIVAQEHRGKVIHSSLNQMLHIWNLSCVKPPPINTYLKPT